jgi:SSS family solute:Na+ symporter
MVSLLTFLGLGMLAYFQHFPGQLSAEISGDKLLPFYIINHMPNGVSGLLITAILAAAMSSMDSGINSVSTVIINDFVKPLRRRKTEESKDVKLARILTFGLGTLAVTIACFVSQIGHILKAAGILTSIFAGPILSLFLLGILMKHATLRGWLVGTVVNIPAMLWIIFELEAHFIYFFPISFSISFIVGAVASLLLGGPQAPKGLTIWDRPSM